MNQACASPLTDPPPSVWQRAYQAWLTVTTALLGLFLLFSPAGTSIALAGLALASPFMIAKAWRLRIWAEPFVWLGLLFFVFIALHGLWIPQQEGGRSGVLGKYGELWRGALLLLVFAVGGKSEVFWRALLLGALAYAGLHVAYWLGWEILPPDFFASRRISAGLGLLAVAWLALGRAAQSPQPWLLRSVAALLAATVLFAVDGRTGHLILLGLAALAGWLYGSKRWRWWLAVSLPLLVLAGAMSSKAVQSRMGDTLSVIKPQAPVTEVGSAGLRKEFYSFGVQTILQRPLGGLGYGNIAPHYKIWITERARLDPTKAPYAAPDSIQQANLHSEFLMQWASGGVVAVLLLVAWLACPVLSRGHGTDIRRSVLGIVLAFSIGSLVNSWLLDFTEGHVYIVLVAWLLSQRYRPS